MERIKTLIPPVLCVAPIALLVLLQGGFFALPTCVVGVLSCVVGTVAWMRLSARKQEVPVYALLLAALAVAYAISAFATGATLTTLGEAGAWAACAGYAIACCALSSRSRSAAFAVLSWLGIATAVIALLLHANMVTGDGAQANRLQFTFGYANAAAAWFGTITFLCLLAPYQRVRSCTALSAAALLQTQSGGGILVFAIIAVVVAVSWVRHQDWSKLLFALAQAVVAVLLFAIGVLAGGILAMLAIIAAIALCYASAGWWQQNAESVYERRAVEVLACVLAVCAVIGAFLLQGRIVAAIASLQERSHMIFDALYLWSTSPLVGIGPNNWQYLYAYVQSVSYYTTVVHSSLAQLAVDAGLLGLVPFVAVCAIGVLGLIKQKGANNSDPNTEPALQSADKLASTDQLAAWTFARLCAALFLLTHACIEFALQFSALAFVLVLLLANTQTLAPRIKGVIAGIACLVLLPICAMGLLCASTSSVIEMSSARGDYQLCARMFTSNPLARADVSAQQEYAASLYDQQQYQQVIDAFARMQAPTDRSVYYAVLAYEAQGMREEATQLLVDRLEKQPYNVEFCQSAKQVAITYGIPSDLNARFGAAVSVVEQRAGSLNG